MKSKKGKILKHGKIQYRSRKKKVKKLEDKKVKHPKSQIFSIDTMIATVIFIAAITGLLVYIGLSSETEELEDIRRESEIIPKMLITTNQSGVSLITMNRIDSNRLRQLADIPYEDLKSMFGVKHDFCVYFEDRNGNLINLSEVINKSYVGIGSQKAAVAGIPCGAG